jgi:hypothetical protein
VPVVSTTVARRQAFAAGQKHVIDLPIALKPLDLGVALFRTLQGESTTYDLRGSMNVGTPFGPLDLPFERSGSTPLAR